MHHTTIKTESFEHFYGDNTDKRTLATQEELNKVASKYVPLGKYSDTDSNLIAQTYNLIDWLPLASNLENRPVYDTFVFENDTEQTKYEVFAYDENGDAKILINKNEYSYLVRMRDADLFVSDNESDIWDLQTTWRKGDGILAAMYAHKDESYIAAKTVIYHGEDLKPYGFYSYENKGQKGAYAACVPKFEDLKGGGAYKIRQYYRNKHEEEKKYAKNIEVSHFVWGRDGYVSLIRPSGSDSAFYDWESDIVGNYLSVMTIGQGDGTGTHGWRNYSVENFDLRTGEKLKDEAVFGKIEEAAPQLNKAVLKHLIEDYGWSEAVDFGKSFDILEHPPIFRFKPEGIEFIFNEYEIGPYAAGSFFVLVPYEELELNLF
ncbi:MAG: RsiV family protein [Oscillospiraceae bacterium]|jgi:hypothetical protein|nr:RsiV family protein [Oscillospiraceae bacterium]